MGNGFCMATTQGITSELASDIDVSSMIARSPARQFALTDKQVKTSGVKVEELGFEGECIVFLEYAHNVPYSDTLRDLTCHAVSSRSHGLPFMRVWAENGGAVIGQVAEWTAKQCNETPSWYSARSLGFCFPKQHDTKLKFELRDQQTLIGSMEVWLTDLPGHMVVTRELETTMQRNSKPCTVSFQVLDSNAVLDRRTVFFVRHGESAWNEAQSRMDLYEMGKTTDHPLSPMGREQAEDLSAQLANADASSTAASMLEAEVVFVSPLTRAVQTAVIGLSQPLLAKRDGAEAHFVLMANAREKQNLGGLDSMGSKLGHHVVQHTLDELRLLYHGKLSGPVMENFKRLKFDAQEVQDRWWHDGASESAAQLEARLQEFMAQLVYTPYRTIVVVGHSHFFRAVFRQFLSKEFEQKDQDQYRALTNMKLPNCGVARLVLDAKASSDRPIVDVELMLGTKMIPDAGKLQKLNCCAAPEIAPKTPEDVVTFPAPK